MSFSVPERPRIDATARYFVHAKGAKEIVNGHHQARSEVPHTMKALAILFLAGLTALALSACTVTAPSEANSVQRPVPDGDYYSGIVQVKFDDEYRIRLRDGALVDLDGKTQQELDALQASTHGHWERAHDVDETTLDSLRESGMAATGEPLADINNYFHLLLAPGWDEADAIASIDAEVKPKPL